MKKLRRLGLSLVIATLFAASLSRSTRGQTPLSGRTLRVNDIEMFGFRWIYIFFVKDTVSNARYFWHKAIGVNMPYIIEMMCQMLGCIQNNGSNMLVAIVDS